FTIPLKGERPSNNKLCTSCIYKLYSTGIGTKHMDLKSTETLKLVSQDEYYKNRAIPMLRFYENGRLNMFLLHPRDTLNKLNFDPRSGYIGVFEVQEEDKLRMEIFWYVGDSGKYVYSE